MANSFQIGSAHPYPWPKTIGFHTLNTTDDIIQHLKNNKIWTVSEKLDGCNLCLSTQGWIASRNIIVSNRESPKLVYQGVQLNKVHEIFLKMDKLKILLQKHLISNVNFDVMVYGELILQGTATTKHDIFNYKERKMLPGDFYGFALGLNFPTTTKIPLIFKNGFFHNQDFFIVPFSFFLKKIFDQCDINCPPILAIGNLNEIIENEIFKDKINKRKIEGVILSGNKGEGLLKWKYIKHPSESLLAHFEKLSDVFPSMKSFQEMCQYSNNFVNTIEETQLKNIMEIYFKLIETKLCNNLKEARKEGNFTFNLILEMEVNQLLNSVKESTVKILDPLLCNTMKEIIRQDIKMYVNKNLM
jgi:hypothetical protein